MSSSLVCCASTTPMRLCEWLKAHHTDMLYIIYICMQCTHVRIVSSAASYHTHARCMYVPLLFSYRHELARIVHARHVYYFFVYYIHIVQASVDEPFRFCVVANPTRCIGLIAQVRSISHIASWCINACQNNTVWLIYWRFVSPTDVWYDAAETYVWHI